MIPMVPGTKVYLACQPVSMRLGFDGLAARVAQVLDGDPFSGHLFLFRGKRAQQATFSIQFSHCQDCLSWHPLFGQTLQVSPLRRGREPPIRQGYPAPNGRKDSPGSTILWPPA
jgi:hypothetical protein